MMRTLIISGAVAALFAGAAVAQTQPSGQMAARLIDRLAAADTDGNGAISEAEMQAQRAAQFSRLDRDGDGVLTAQEARPPMGAGRQGGQMMQQMMTSADANGDGSVTQAEFVAAPSPLFDRADANADGMVTRAELDALRAAARQGG